jgi:hypothetical protein
VAAIASFMLASIRTLGKIQWTAWIGLACTLSLVSGLEFHLKSTNTDYSQ